MSLLDFKEIPQANSADGRQDTFELFAREFFDAVGMKTLDGPDRGADGGRDLIVEEKRSGILGDTVVRWLVSCKHYAHSGKSVGTDNEVNIKDRLVEHGCKGFIGFYSTIISAGLNQKLNGFKDEYEVQVYDAESIERILLNNPNARKLIERFFPESNKKIAPEKVINLFKRYQPLQCRVCGKDLLQKDIVGQYTGNIVLTEDREYFNENMKTKYTGAFCVCKGHCDHLLSQNANKKGQSTSWEDISDLIIPFQYLKFVMSIMNNLFDGGAVFTEEAFEEIKQILLAIAQVTMRSQTEEDIRRIESLLELPEWI